MAALSDWRSLHSVMALTIYVALVSYLIRVTVQPDSLIGAFVVGVPVALSVAVFVLWPISRAFSRALEPGTGPGDGACRACGHPTRVALFRKRGSPFSELAGYRCPRCRTTFRKIGEFIVQEPPIDFSAPMPELGIWFEGDDRPPSAQEP